MKKKSVVRAKNPPVLMNCGCGIPGSERLPSFFQEWNKVRVDIDPEAQPDILADITDLSIIPDGAADAVFTAHCIEHLYAHQVVVALSEFRRILKDDGFVCITVPDVQTVANYVAADRLHEVLYQSKSGPITAHDVIYGFGAALAVGRTSMAHRCGFTPKLLVQRLVEAGFEEVAVRRRPSLELAAVARKTRAGDEAQKLLLDALER